MLRVRAAWLGVVGFVFSIRLLRVSYMFSIEQALLSSWKRWDTVRDVLGLRPHLPPRFGCRENPMMPLGTLLTGGGGGSGRGDLGSRSSVPSLPFPAEPFLSILPFSWCSLLLSFIPGSPSFLFWSFQINTVKYDRQNTDPKPHFPGSLRIK